jgi:pimeloyl-ACP methyl ester carboxylesterase
VGNGSLSFIPRTNASQSQEILHFAPGPSAQPQLAGQWLPAGPDARYRNLTILFLPSGDGDRTTSVATQTALHNLGLNLFVFDYRGYGQSVNMHPSQERMLEDSESAWSYLTGFRNVSGATIIPYGIGVGTSLATHLALAHTEIPAVILDSPHADLSSVLWKDSSLRLLPTSLLFHETFPLADPLSQLQRPKLLIAAEKDPNPASFSRAADPKISVTLPTDSGPLFDRSVTRFLDQYLAQYLTQSLAVPSPAPSATKPN